MSPEARLTKLEGLIANLIRSDRYLIHNLLELADGHNILLGTSTGNQIGTTTSQKIAFLGATPVSRQAAITPATGGATQDAEARARIDSIITILEQFGFVAPN